MHHIKSCLLIMLIYLSSSSLLFGQCPAVISPASPAPVCQPNAVQLTANADPGGSFQWQRNGVDIPTANQSIYTATESGSYTVRVDGPTCTASVSNPVTVTVNPVPAQPDFLINPNTVQCSGSPINFSVVSPQPNFSYIWDFGDGTTVEGSTVIHTFTSLGSQIARFDVKLYSRSPEGCSSPVTTKRVEVNQRPNFVAPTDSSNFQVCIPETQDTVAVKASLLNNTPEPNDITSYVVDFGDGAGPKTFSPAEFTSTNPIRNSIAYDTTGSFPITIRAIGSNGCETVFTKIFEINRKPKGKFSAKKDKLVPRVPPKDCVPVKVTVDSDSSTGANLAYKWFVKDNQGQNVGASVYEYLESTNDTSANPVFRFNISGRYSLEMVVSNSCGTDTTKQSLLIGYPEIRLSADTTVCYDPQKPVDIFFGGNQINYDPNLGTIDESSYRWEITGTSGATFIDGSSAQVRNPTIRFPNVGQYKVKVRVGNECGSSAAVEQFEAEATITVNARPNAPSLATTSTNICSGASVVIRPSGPGPSYRFYEVSAGGTPKAEGLQFDTGPVNQTTTFYVATLSPQGCESLNRTAFTVNVFPVISNNSISLTNDQQQVCSGQSIQGVISGSTATGGSGNITYLWQRSTTSESAGFTNGVTPNNQKDYTPGNLTATTWFRRIVSSGSCPRDTSNVVMITVSPAVGTNTISLAGGSPATVCQGQAAPDITGSVPNGSPVILWESSTNGTTYGAAAGANSGQNYSPGVLSQTTWFRRRLTSGACSSVSTAVQVIVSPAISNNAISLDNNQQGVCSGQSIPGSITGTQPTGGSGTLQFLWQRSTTSNSTGFGTAPGTSNTQNYSPGSLTTTTWFRRIVRSSTGSCADTSNVVQIRVSPAIGANTITRSGTGTGPICQGQQAPALNGSNPGSYEQIIWQSSTTGTSDADFGSAAGVNNGLNYQPGILSQTTWFRRVITSGACTSTSNIVEIQVVPQIGNNTIERDQEICAASGRPATITGSSPTGGTTQRNYRWEQSTTGRTSGFSAISSSDVKDYSPPVLSQTTWFRRVVISGTCDNSVSNVVEVKVIPAITGNTISAGQTAVCQGNTTTISGSNVSGGVGTLSYVWESSTTSSSSGFVQAAGNSTSRDYTTLPTNQRTWYRRKVSTEGSNCPASVSNVVEVKIEEAPAAPTVETADVRSCLGSPATLRATGNAGTYEWYRDATGGTAVFVGKEYVTEPLLANATFYVQVRTANQCVSPTRTPVRVTVTTATANAGRDTTIIEGQFASLRASGGVSYKWTPATGLSSDMVANPAARPSYDMTNNGQITYTVEVTDINGCKAYDEVTVTVIPRVRIVNTFSPNNDGINEVWDILNIESYPDATVEIFNRWGAPVFNSKGYSKPWDGTHNGKPLPMDTYYYVIRLKSGESPLKGSVTIIR